MVCLSVTAPVITVSSALPWFRIEQLALPAIVLSYLWLLLVGEARPVRPNWMFLIGVVYAICVSVSLLYGWVFLGHTVIVRDLYEIPKVFFPVVFFMLGLETDLTESSLRKLLGYFSLAMILVCLYAWAQWMDIGVSHTLANFYSGGAHDEGSLSHYRRVYSTMGNPNVLGQLMTWAIAGFTLAALLGVGNRLLNLVMTLACLVTLAMTGSRYGLLDTGAALGLLILLPSIFRGRRRASLALLLVLLPLFAGVVLFVAKSNRATGDRLQTLRNPLTTDSLSDRVNDLWRDAGEEFIESPFLGHGPAKTIFSGIFTDSEYLDVLKEFGGIGFLVYLAYYVYPARVLWKGLRRTAKSEPELESRIPATFWALHLSFIMTITALIMNIGMSSFYNLPLQGFLWMWMGIGAAAARSLARVDRAAC
ncbi:MAG: O-antigen ligase family protein [Acidobacteriia bacterium]|nr:O-antigen ligase family protein [Terriglobia bacterium]